MADYKYDNVIIYPDNLATVAIKINRLLGIMPSGLNDGGNTTIVSFFNDLTPQQKTQLDNFMSGANLDVIPDNSANSNYAIDYADTIKTATGLDCDIYPTPTGVIVQFYKVLTSNEKNTIKNYVAGLLRQI